MINSYLVDDLWTVVAPDPPYDDYNKPNAPIVAAVKGLVQWETKIVKDLQGNDVTSNRNVLMRTDIGLTHNDQLRIYDIALGKNLDYRIITIKPAKGYFTVGVYVYL